MITLGQKYKDSATGIIGVATAVTEYEYGCRRVVLEVVGKDENKNAAILEYSFDEQRLISTSTAKEGGPGSIPTQRSMAAPR